MTEVRVADRPYVRQMDAALKRVSATAAVLEMRRGDMGQAQSAMDDATADAIADAVNLAPARRLLLPVGDVHEPVFPGVLATGARMPEFSVVAPCGFPPYPLHLVI